MSLLDNIARARVLDLERTRFAGMPIHPAHKPGHFYDKMTERDPDTKMTLFGHVHLLVTHGIHSIENLNLDELAAAGHHELAFIGIPLKCRGATGSPIRPLALVE